MANLKALSFLLVVLRLKILKEHFFVKLKISITTMNSSSSQKTFMKMQNHLYKF